MNSANRDDCYYACGPHLHYFHSDSLFQNGTKSRDLVNTLGWLRVQVLQPIDRQELFPLAFLKSTKLEGSRIWLAGFRVERRGFAIARHIV